MRASLTLIRVEPLPERGAACGPALPALSPVPGIDQPPSELVWSDP